MSTGAARESSNLSDNRHYKTTDLPTLREEYSVGQNRDLLFKSYEQVCSIWKQLVDVRFKLLALVPGASLALITGILLSKPSEGILWLNKLLVCVFGIFITLGLFLYDLRNSALHDDLISRGRKIEDELGIHTGIFRGRLKPKGIVKHKVATGIIYGSSLLAWAAAILLIVYQR